MAINEKLTARVRQALSSHHKLEEKRMFRGIAFMLNEKLCVTVGDDRVMVRIDPALHNEAIAVPGVSTVIMKGREYRGYVYVNESVVYTEKDLHYWIDLAVAFNQKPNHQSGKNNESPGDTGALSFLWEKIIILLQ